MRLSYVIFGVWTLNVDTHSHQQVAPKRVFPFWLKPNHIWLTQLYCSPVYYVRWSDLWGLCEYILMIIVMVSWIVHRESLCNDDGDVTFLYRHFYIVLIAWGAANVFLSGLASITIDIYRTLDVLRRRLWRPQRSAILLQSSFLSESVEPEANWGTVRDLHKH